MPTKKISKYRQPIFGHGSLINPSAEHTILDPFQPPMQAAEQVYQNLAHTALASEALPAVHLMEPIIISPDGYQTEPGQPLPSID